MKKIGLILLSLLLSTQIYAQKTTTTTTFKDVSYGSTPIGGVENEYGETELYKEATISTQNFKVDNFWDKFSDSKNGTSTYNQVSKMGLFKLTVEGSFACAKAGLVEEGCSGQKPFLLNQKWYENTDITKDANGNSLPDGEYRIPFNNAANYKIDNTGAFFALDVDRNEDYYKEPEDGGESSKNFFKFIVDMFKNYFSKTETVYGDAFTPEEAARRDRYIANIVFGHDREHRLKKAGKTAATSVDTSYPVVGDPVSLIDYEEDMLAEESGCDMFFIDLDSSSLPCRMMTGMGFANWMPFFDDDTTYEVASNKGVMSDTELTLLSLASELDNKNYNTNFKESEGSGILSEIFKPMTFMMGSMIDFFFWDKPKVTTKQIAVNYNFDNYLKLMFAITDGVQVTDFANFDLLGVESVYGTQITECRIQQKTSSSPMGWMKDMMFGMDEYVITSGTPLDSDLKEVYLGKTRKIFGDNPAIDEHNKLNTRREEIQFCIPLFGCSGTGEDKVWATLTNEDWLDWCTRNQDAKDFGFFGSFFENIVDLFTKPKTYDDQIDDLLNDANFRVKEYKEKVHRGLILHLKKSELEMGQTGTTTKYKLMNVK